MIQCVCVSLVMLPVIHWSDAITNIICSVHSDCLQPNCPIIVSLWRCQRSALDPAHCPQDSGQIVVQDSQLARILSQSMLAIKACYCVSEGEMKRCSVIREKTEWTTVWVLSRTVSYSTIQSRRWERQCQGEWPQRAWPGGWHGWGWGRGETRKQQPGQTAGMPKNSPVRQRYYVLY